MRHSDKLKVQLIVALANKGLITFRRKIKERIGLFFVKKKTPEWIRMVIDARRVNASHREPPCTRLSTPRSFLDLQLEPTHDGSPLAFGIEADVNDCFYNYFTEALASWFGIDRPGTLGFWRQQGWMPTQLFDDDLGGFHALSDDTTVYPVFRGLCMGWSWSLFFANESVNFIASGRIERPIQQIRDKAPVPSIQDAPIVGVYVDNISIIGRTFDETVSAAAKVKTAFDSVNIPLTWTHSEPSPVFESVGLILDFNTGSVRNKPKRLWKAFLAGRELLRRRKVPTKLLEFWLGHMTSLFMVTPSALSAFFHIYRYINTFRSRRAALWGNVRQEIRTALGLLWMTSASIVFDPIKQVDVGDSSSGAFALLTTVAEKHEIRELCKWREVWRYQPIAQSVKDAVESGSRAMVIDALKELEGESIQTPLLAQEVRPCAPFGAAFRTAYADWLMEFSQQNKTWHATSAIATQFKSRRRRRLELDVATVVPPVSSQLCEAGRFTLLWRRKWRRTDWHINAKEAQVSLSSIRRAARVTSLHGKIKITLCDNLPALCSFERGRSSSSRLNRICQQAAAYQIGTGIRWRLRHIESLRNPADKDSRFHQIAKQELRRPNRPVVSPLVERGFAPGLAVDSASQELGTHPSQSSTASRACQGRSQPRGGLFLELFAGTARLTSAIREQKCAVLRGVDICNGSHHDLRRRTSQLIILHWLKSGIVRYVHLGTPCTVFSRARHAIRHVERAREKERVGLEFALFTAEVIMVCNRYNISWSVENPRHSRLFDVPFLEPLLHHPTVIAVDIDFCRYGEKYKKPTRIFTNFADLKSLSRHCCHRSHAEILRGSERVKIGDKYVSQPKTRKAGAYPFPLTCAWALIAQKLLAPASRDNSLLEQQCEHELFAVQKTANTREPVQTTAGRSSGIELSCSLVSQLESEVPQAREFIVFGQHSNADVSRRRQGIKKVRQADPKKIFSLWSPSTPSQAQTA